MRVDHHAGRSAVATARRGRSTVTSRPPPVRAATVIRPRWARMPGMDLRPELLAPPVSPERQEQLGKEIGRIAELMETGRLMEAR